MPDQLTPGQARMRHREAFRAFWDAYPRKTHPTEAERVFADLIENKGIDPVKLVESARAFAARSGEDLKYCPGPHNWLKNGQYDDADLFSDETAGQLTWLKQQWKTANLKAVENRYHITMPKTYPPDEMTDPADIKFWFREQVRAFITTVAMSKGAKVKTTELESTKQ